MSVLVCADVEAAYNGSRVLAGVTVRVEPGEWVALIGPNGAGKSTLLRVVAGVMAPTAGEVTIGGEALDVMTRRAVSRRVAMVPQTPTIPDGMTVREYVLLGRTPYISYWGTESAEDVAKVTTILERLDLQRLGDRPMQALSGGERQRAVLARALAQEAGLLLLDEPTAALDLGHQQQVLDHVDELRRANRVGVLSAMHDLTLAALYADRLVLLDRGLVVASGSAAEVLTSENLDTHFEATVSILHDAAGRLIVAPRRPS
jgi:iron complex transport system ATP-binding protein